MKKGFDLLWKLPTEQRKTLYLYYYEGHHTKEIANLLDLSIHEVQDNLLEGKNSVRNY